MKIFISRPTVIGPKFETAYTAFRDHLVSQGFVLQRLGSDNYSKKAPLHAVIDLIKESCGALVLGYPQLEFQHVAVRSRVLILVKDGLLRGEVKLKLLLVRQISDAEEELPLCARKVGDRAAIGAEPQPVGPQLVHLV